MTDPHDRWPVGFFDRADDSDDGRFYSQPRLVTHIDDHAIGLVTELYRRLGLTGRLLDLMSSWISHLGDQPEHLTALGMNAAELDVNPMADETVVHDLNNDPTLPFDDNTFDAAMCAVSVDYLTRPIDVFAEVARVVRHDGIFVCTFSNRCFPTKAIRGWLSTDDAGHCELVAEYFRQSAGWREPTIEVAHRPGIGVDPLYAVWSRVG